MSKFVLVAAVVLLLVTALSAHAKVPFGADARYLGMGGTGIAVADDLGAADYNPANLGTMSLGVHRPDHYLMPNVGPSRARERKSPAPARCPATCPPGAWRPAASWGTARQASMAWP